MKIYIAKDGETLITISKKHRVELERLISLNPHIASPDLNLSGIKVKISSPGTLIRKQTHVSLQDYDRDCYTIGKLVVKEELNMSTPYTRNPLMKGFTEDYFVLKDGVKIRYLYKGSGMPLIFVPPFGGMADVYALNAPAFTDDFSVYVLEMRGHGFSDAPAHGAHVFRLSADLHEFIESLNAPKVNLIGASMGCSVIWGYIELFGQDKLNKLVFVNQPPFLSANPYDSKEEILQYGGNRIDIWHVHHVYSRNFYEGWPVLRTYFERPYVDVTPEIAAYLPDNYAEKMALMPEYPKVDKAQGQFLADLIRDVLWLDWRGIFPLIKVPVLYLVGDMSHAMTPESIDWVSKAIPNCKVVRFTEKEFGVHELYQTAYKKFNDSVMEFLK